jgi:(2Fe-2S) ferredoxin
MYVGLTKDKIDRIIDEHIIGGNVVSEYVVPDAMRGEAVAPAS